MSRYGVWLSVIGYIGGFSETFDTEFITNSTCPLYQVSNDPYDRWLTKVQWIAGIFTRHSPNYVYGWRVLLYRSGFLSAQN